MSPRTKEQFETIRNEKEALILETALRLFAKKGYLSTPVSLIAKEAGISKGLMYNYFKSKEDLLHKVVFDNADQFLEFLVIEDINDVKKHEIVKFIEGTFSLMVREHDFFKLYFSLLVQPDVYSLFGDEMMKIFEGIILAINNYYEKNGFKNAYIKTRYLLAVFDGVGMHYIVDPDTFPLEEVKKLIIEQL
ncbi:MAG: TetR/AcrR family transcriptional regulator [Bacteroidota bacterium]